MEALVKFYPLLAALAGYLMGSLSALYNILFVASRCLEGLAAAAGVPALLAHLTDATAGQAVLRARMMSYYKRLPRPRGCWVFRCSVSARALTDRPQSLHLTLTPFGGDLAHPVRG